LIFRKKYSKWFNRLIIGIITCIVILCGIGPIILIIYFLEPLGIKCLCVFFAIMWALYLYNQYYNYLNIHEPYSSLEDDTDTWTKITKERGN